jgi:hypothetical protein
VSFNQAAQFLLGAIVLIVLLVVLLEVVDRV